MKTAYVITADGDEQWELVAEKNGLGVTETPNGFFSVTHLNTGRKIGLCSFLTEAGARGFMESIADIYPWTELKENFEKGQQPLLAKKVRANFELWQANEDTNEDHP